MLEFFFINRSKTILRYACFRQRLHGKEIRWSSVPSKAFRLLRAAVFMNYRISIIDFTNLNNFLKFLKKVKKSDGQ